MGKWGILLGGLFFVILVVGVVVGTSYQHWVRAKAKIESLPADKQEEAWKQFEGYAPLSMSGGILAGSLGNRIWVWGRLGLESFRVDEYSVYSWYDGCNEAVLADLNSGIAGAIGREILTDIGAWRERARVGDYVRVYITTEGKGGTVGNLREIYTYNYWQFLPVSMEVRCAR